MAVRGLCCAAALAAVLTACGGEPASTPSASNDGPCATTSTSGAAGVSLLPITPASVTVTDPGAADRKVLAASPDITAAQQVTITTTSSEARAGGQTTQSVTMPLTARIGCTDPTDVEMSLGAVTSPDVVLADALKAEHNARVGMSLGPGTMPVSLRISAPDAASSQARSAVEQTLVQTLQHSVAFPITPVGTGATWRSVRTLTGAATTTQTITSTLRSRTGDTVTIDVTVDETPVNDVFAVPGTNQTLRINRYSMTGTGTLTMDLRRALPTSGTITTNGARELVGAGAPLLQQMGFSVSYASR
ncbi:hypothetical protein HH308_23530 [Gordonia sp. TBRC 11910]|uniref:Lipoprotein n=1 Tax=Gordonia asplenii TaxID=2725283 RepID=A0A848L689_9ACTN|nr:hypothetical protein [Gordonia asplenii]